MAEEAIEGLIKMKCIEIIANHIGEGRDLKIDSNKKFLILEADKLYKMICSYLMENKLPD